MTETDRHYDDTLATLRRLAQSAELRDSERETVAEDLRDIDAMLAKLEQGVVEIAVFGEINSGKSSLLNALIGRKVFATSAEGGKTRERDRHDWQPDLKSFRGLADSRLVVVDTPGLNEVGGLDRAVLAHKVVRYSDIVLFVSFGDLNDNEYAAIRMLHELDKPIVLVLNKIDLFRRHELTETLTAVQRRVAGLIGEADIVFAAADPRPMLRLATQLDGRQHEEEVQRPPIVEDLQARILEILMREGKAVVALNANLFAAEVSERIARLKVEARQMEAETLINRFMWVKACAVALNPIPLADIAGGALSDAVMVQRLGEVYGQSFSRANAQRLIGEILGAWGVAVTVEWVTHFAAGALKTTVPLLGHAIAAVPQAMAAAWTCYVVGQAAMRYFRDGGWGPRGAKAIVREIVDGIDQDSVLKPLKERLLTRLAGKQG